MIEIAIANEAAHWLTRVLWLITGLNFLSVAILDFLYDFSCRSVRLDAGPSNGSFDEEEPLKKRAMNINEEKYGTVTSNH